MTKLLKNIFLFLILFLLVINIQANENIKKLNIIKIFPTDKQMDKYNFALGWCFTFSFFEKEFLFSCDQKSHAIFKFDLDGNFIKKIGTLGQGPGDFNKPYTVYIYKNKMIVGDNGNMRIQILSLNGDYEKSIKIINIMHQFVITDNRIFMLIFEHKVINRKTANIFGIFNIKGEIIKKIKGSFFSDYKRFGYDNKVRLKLKNGFVHCLQMYGTTYRIYNIDGDLIKEVKLEINPLKDKEYKKIKYLYTYTAFDVYDKKIYASYVAVGKIIINVFDMNGHYLYKYISKQVSDEKYHVNEMRVIKKNNKKLLYLLMWQPETEFIVAEIE